MPVSTAAVLGAVIVQNEYSVKLSEPKVWNSRECRGNKKETTIGPYEIPHLRDRILVDFLLPLLWHF